MSDDLAISHEDPDFRKVRPASFVCTPDGCLYTVVARPPEQLAAALLEDIGDWLRMIGSMPHGAEVPPPVREALVQAHDTVCQWTDWLDTRSASQRRAVRIALSPTPPDRAG